MTTEAEYVAGVREFVEGELLDGEGDDLTADTPLLDWGILDSRSVPKLIEFVDRRFGIHVSEDEIHPRNFESIAAIGRMLARLG